MEIIKVGIYHDDRVFARALAIGLARESRTIHFVLINNMDSKEELDLILSSRESDNPKVVQLVQNQELKQRDATPYRLFQYEESRSLIDDLLFIYFKMTGRVLEYRGTSKCRLLTFASDAGGSGTTMICISAAKMLYRTYGSRILYLNLCPIDDSKKYLKSDGSTSLLKLLYYIDTGKDFPLESFITKEEEFDYINTGVMNAYFNDIKPALMSQLLKKVDGLGEYDYLLLDIGSHLSRENKTVLENSNLVIFVHRWQNHEPAAYYENISQAIRKKADGSKLLVIENFAGDDWRQESDEEIWISKDPEAVQLDQKEGVLNVDLSRNYGVEIAAIAKRIAEDT